MFLFVYPKKKRFKEEAIYRIHNFARGKFQDRKLLGF